MVNTPSTVTVRMGIKRIQREPTPPTSHLSLIRPLLSRCLPHHHQSGREWPTGLHRGRADLVWAHCVLEPKSFHTPDIVIENGFSALSRANELYLGPETLLRRRSLTQCQMHKDNLVISLMFIQLEEAWGGKHAYLLCSGCINSHSPTFHFISESSRNTSIERSVKRKNSVFSH